MKIEKEALYEQVLAEWPDKDKAGFERSVISMFMFMNQYWDEHDIAEFRSSTHLPDRWRMLPSIISDRFLDNDVAIDLHAKSSILKKEVMSIVIDKLSGFKFDYNDVKLISVPTIIIIAKEYKKRKRLYYTLPQPWDSPKKYLFITYVTVATLLSLSLGIMLDDLCGNAIHVTHHVFVGLVSLSIVINWLFRRNLMKSSYVNRDEYIKHYSYSIYLCLIGILPSFILYIRSLM